MGIFLARVHYGEVIAALCWAVSVWTFASLSHETSAARSGSSPGRVAFHVAIRPSPLLWFCGRFFGSVTPPLPCEPHLLTMVSHGARYHIKHTSPACPYAVASVPWETHASPGLLPSPWCSTGQPTLKTLTPHFIFSACLSILPVTMIQENIASQLGDCNSPPTPYLTHSFLYAQLLTSVLPEECSRKWTNRSLS